MSDKEVLIYEEELNFLKRIAEKSSDLIRGYGWAEFCKACGGIEKLKKEHAKAVNDWEGWLSEGISEII